jgi:hypothetical protein
VGGGGPERVVVSEDVSVYQLLITDKNNTAFAFYGKSEISDFWASGCCIALAVLLSSSFQLTLLLLSWRGFKEVIAILI